MNRPSRRSALLPALAALPVLYVGAYLALLEPSTLVVVDHLIYFHRSPQYRAGGETTEAIFRPASWIDRKLRPSYWDWEEDSGTMPYSDEYEYPADLNSDR